MEDTKIQWCDHTFNAWIGCTKVHQGCANCYAEADMDSRRHRVKWGPDGTRCRTTDDYWRQPLRWQKQAFTDRTAYQLIKEQPCISGAMVSAALGLDFEANPACIVRLYEKDYIRPNPGNLGGWLADEECKPYQPPRVFCGSYMDWAEDWGDKPIVNARGEQLMRGTRPLLMDDVRADLFHNLVDRTPDLIWMMLTKRPERIPSCFIKKAREPSALWCDKHLDNPARNRWFYRENVWLGISVSDQETADRMVPELEKSRDLAPVRFVSYEPMLGPIDWTRHFYVEDMIGDNSTPGLSRLVYERRGLIQGVIMGGESGTNARACRETWIRDSVRQCRDAGVAPYVKQMGSNAETGEGCHRKLKLKDKKGGNPSEWPEDLRVRELPT